MGEYTPSTQDPLSEGRGRQRSNYLLERLTNLFFYLYEWFWANTKKYLPHSAKCGWKLLERDKKFSKFICRSGVCSAGALLSSVIPWSLLSLTFGIHLRYLVFVFASFFLSLKGGRGRPIIRRCTNSTVLLWPQLNLFINIYPTRNYNFMTIYLTKQGNSKEEAHQTREISTRIVCYFTRNVLLGSVASGVAQSERPKQGCHFLAVLPAQSHCGERATTYRFYNCMTNVALGEKRDVFVAWWPREPSSMM